MRIVQRVSANPWQRQSLALDDGTTFSLELYFRPMQQGWFINELVYGDFVLRGTRVVSIPNMLNQWRNLLPFGLGCFSVANRDPQLQEDFISGAATLYVLSAAEVTEYAEYLRLG